VGVSKKPGQKSGLEVRSFRPTGKEYVMSVLGQMAPMVAAAGNFPANYPYAYSGPLPSALLRPLQQPLNM